MIEEISFRTDPKKSRDPETLKSIVSREIGVPPEKIHDFRITRRSLDARQKNVMVNLTLQVAYGEDKKVKAPYSPVDYKNLPPDATQVVIVGAGPAGLFAALKSIELGMRPVVLERGSDVDSRRIELAMISRSGKVDPDSNYCFGEGGAGAYSDGKLFTRSKKRGNVREILEILHQHGAAEDILIDSHPHIGSDKLPEVIKNIRKTIERCGGEVHFHTKVTGLIVEDGIVSGVVAENGDRFYGPVILATGHSARDIYRMLHDSGITVEAKSLAIGVRLEHPQYLIDCLQYHSKEGRGKYLPAAAYSYVCQADGRGVYSFCMCPGGVVVPAMSGPGQSVVNGMSASARASQWANSGMVVELHPGDISGYEEYGPLEMLALQEDLEWKFYEESGESINAPAQRMKDFVEGKESESLPRSSYAPGIHPARLDHLLPPAISSRLKSGFRTFEKRSKGFLTNDAILVGLESRTSSPVRIPRDKDTLEHISTANLFPSGEGAGFAGGIVSAAIDGQRCAEAIYSKLFGNKEIETKSEIKERNLECQS